MAAAAAVLIAGTGAGIALASHSTTTSPQSGSPSAPAAASKARPQAVVRRTSPLSTRTTGTRCGNSAARTSARPTTRWSPIPRHQPRRADQHHRPRRSCSRGSAPTKPPERSRPTHSVTTVADGVITSGQQTLLGTGDPSAALRPRLGRAPQPLTWRPSGSRRWSWATEAVVLARPQIDIDGVDRACGRVKSADRDRRLAARWPRVRTISGKASPCGNPSP